MVVFMAMFVLVRVVMTMVVIVYVVMLMVMDVVMYVEMGDGVLMPMIVFMVIMVIMVIMVMIAVVVMIVVMVVVVVVPLLLAVDGHRHVGARDATGHRRLRRHVDARETQAVHLLQEGGLLLLAQKLKEGSGKHVASAPHGTFDVKVFHVISPPVLPFD